MKILSWNYRGFRSPAVSEALHDLVKKESPSLIFLSKTKFSSYEIEMVKHRLGMFGVSVDSCSRAGGLCLLWAKDLKVDLRSKGQHYSDVLVNCGDVLSPWRLIGVYGWAENGEKFKTSNLLCDLGRDNNLP